MSAVAESELKGRHISLFSNQEDVIKYTNKLKECVKDVTETTFVVPKLLDKALQENKID